MTTEPESGPADMSDLLVIGGDVVTMNEGREVLTSCTVAVSNGRIRGLGAAERMRALFPGAEELDAAGCVVVPGLIDAHQHTTADPFVRSMIPDDITSNQSIFDWVVPLHAVLDGDDDELAATITAVDALTRGVTTLFEPGTVANPLRVAAGLETAGIRGRVGRWGWDVAGMPYSAPLQESLAMQAETVAALPADGIVTGWITLVGHDLASDELFQGAAALATRLDVGLTLHMSPGNRDIAAYAERSGLRPIVHLHRLGVLGPRLLLGHAVWLDDTELDLLCESGTAVASCPGAYLRLAQGYTRAGRHGEFVRRGGRLALGCDSHNAGDTPDVFRAAYLLAALERDRGADTSVGAHRAFALATIEGARAVGIGDLVGSLEVGKAADLVVLDATGPGWIPRGDLALMLIWGAGSADVRDVVVDGDIVVRDRRVTTVDLKLLRAEAQERSAAALRRARIDVPHVWPVLACEDGGEL